MRKLILAFLVVFLCGVTLLTFASSQKEGTSGAKQATISFWFIGNLADETNLETPWQMANMDTFMEANPNVKVEVTMAGEADEYLNKLNTAMAANVAPDMFVGWLSGRMKPYVDSNRLYPLDDVIANSPGINKVTNPAFLDTATFNGKVYAIPQKLTAEVVFYNKAIFRQAGVSVPETFSELLTVVRKLRAAGTTPFALGNQSPWPGAIFYFAIFDRLIGQELYKDVVIDHNSKWDQPEFVETAQYLLQLRDAGAFPDNFNSISYGESASMFYGGEAAMFLTGTWITTQALAALGDDVGFFNVPVVEGGEGTMDGWILNKDSGYQITSKSEQKEECVMLLEHILSNDRQKLLAEMGALIAPVNIQYDERKVPTLISDLMRVFGTAKYSVIPWDNPLGSAMGIEFNNATKAILSDEDPAETFKRLQIVSEDEWGK
jgi:raffinose/stachyose/melibiose transport system substrate-binding protein